MIFDVLIFVLSLDIYIIADEEDNQHALKLHRLVPSIIYKKGNKSLLFPSKKFENLPFSIILSH